MSKINLTNPKRKNTPSAKPEQFFAKEKKAGDQIYKARYNKIFQDSGLDFFKAYEVLYEFYWMEYDLISKDAIDLYNTLLFLARKNKEFTLDHLAKALTSPANDEGKRTGKGSDTLRKILDELENADLIEIVKVSDEIGQRNDYILKTPLHSNKEFNNFHKQRILNAKEDVPSVFLEDQLEHLRHKIKYNHAKN